MMSAKDLVSKGPRPNRYLYRDPLEKYLCYQLSGNDPVILAEACRIVDDLGADLIDLNGGCPKAKIRKKGAGSYLLGQSAKLGQILSAMRAATNRPLTLKIRVDGNSDERHHMTVAHIAEQEGIDALIVHGRHWRENYDDRCHYHQIAEIVDAVRIPVIANGDVSDRQTLAKVFEQSHAQGVMIARAGTGKPWLYQQLSANGTTSTPTLNEQIRLFIEHIESLANLEGEKLAVMQSRRFAKYYFPGQETLLAHLMRCERIEQIHHCCHI